MSQVVKFLEGLIMDKVRVFSERGTSNSQFGFRKGRNIDQCKD